MLLMINIIFYRMALAPFRMATAEFPERYEHCIVHTVFEHNIMNFVLFNCCVDTMLTLSEYASLYLNIDVVDCILCVNIDRA